MTISSSLSLSILSVSLISLSFFIAPAAARGGDLSSDLIRDGRHLLDNKPNIDVTRGYMSNLELENAVMAFGERCGNISRIYSIGKSVKEFPLWVMEVSNNPGKEERKPAFKFIGNVHGDEPVGRELLMRLANWLCDNYKKDPLATLIIENVHLHILPSLNPDGFELRKRGNANDIDLNRDFPDQQGALVMLDAFVGRSQKRNFFVLIHEELGTSSTHMLYFHQSCSLPPSCLSHSFDNPSYFSGVPTERDGLLEMTKFFDVNNDMEARQPETKAVMRWSQRIKFTASATLHGGALVANYPWDGTQNKRRNYYACPDDKTFQFLAKIYSESHYNMSLSKEFPGGITNGAAWYPIYGAMQDWNYIHAGCFELTLEISDDKWPIAEELPILWEYNKMSMLNLVAALVKSGVHGRVMSSDKGRPLPATIAIKGINYTVVARESFADYHRLLAPGVKYEVTASMTSYKSKSTVVLLEKDAASTADFILDPEDAHKGQMSLSSCDCNCDSFKSSLEMVGIFAKPHLEISGLVVIIALFFFLFVSRRKVVKHRQSAASKRPMAV